MNTRALLHRAKVDSSEDKKSTTVPVESVKSAPVAAPKAVKGTYSYIQ